MSIVNYEPPPTVAGFISSEKFYNFIVGPVGCLAPRTKVITEFGAIPIADIDRPMRVLSWNEKTCLYQLSWCGGSFRKGTDYLYRVSTPQGEFDAAGAHLLLCADGQYRRVEELRPGDALASYPRTPGSCCTDRPVLSISRVAVKESYWDMQVEGTHNYVTVDGAIHHNSSKTTGLLFKILYHAARQTPGPDGIRRTRWVVVRNTLPQLKDTTIRSFFTWFKPGEAGTWSVTDNQFVFRFDDIIAEVLFRPLDTADDVHRVLSLEVTGAVLDEFVEIPKEIVEALSARCGRYPSAKDGGPTWWGMWGASNPGNEDDWWYEWLYSTKPSNLGYFEQPDGMSPYAENVENLPGGREYYTNLMDGKSAAWINQFIHVKWGYSLRGKPVYSMFNKDLHVSKVPLTYNPHLPLLMGFDAGLTPAAILGQQDSYGRVLVLRELTSANMGATRFCREKLKPLLRRDFDGASLMVIADPATKHRAETDERSVANVLETELGVRVKPAFSNTLADRLGAVEEYLTRLTEAGPAYLLDPSCKVLISGYTSGYRYPVSTKGRVGDSPEKNDASHPHDANQYLCMGFSREAQREARRKKSGVKIPIFSNPYV